MLGMDGSPISVAVGLVYLAIVIGLTWRLLRRRKRYGPAATGTMHDQELCTTYLTKDRRTEDRDGNLPGSPR